MTAPTATSRETLLQFEGLSLLSAETGALLVQDISFEIKEGLTVGLVGESGAGKSLLALSTVWLFHGVEPCQGDVLFDKISLKSLSENELRKIRGREIGLIFQEPSRALDPLMRIGDQVAELFQCHASTGASDSRAEAKAALARAGVEEPDRIAASYPHQLSGGQLQRCLIALGTALRPRLLVADEPTSALDAGVQAEVLHLIREQQAQIEAAMLFISHDLAVVTQLADWIVVLQEGRIVEQGPTERLLNRPAEAYTKLLVETASRTPC